jgi:purine-nucleoside phosphorylase
MTATSPDDGVLEHIDAAAALVRQRVGEAPDVALILGSGLGTFATTLAEAVRVPYAEIPHWPRTNVVGHAGLLVAGRVGPRRVLALSGRTHFY